MSSRISALSATMGSASAGSRNRSRPPSISMTSRCSGCSRMIGLSVSYRSIRPSAKPLDLHRRPPGSSSVAVSGRWKRICQRFQSKTARSAATSAVPSLVAEDDPVDLGRAEPRDADGRGLQRAGSQDLPGPGREDAVAPRTGSAVGAGPRTAPATAIRTASTAIRHRRRGRVRSVGVIA